MTVADGALGGRRAVVVGWSGTLSAALVEALVAAGASVRSVPGATQVATAGGLDILVVVLPPSERRPFLDRDDASWAADLAARIGEPLRAARIGAAAMAAGGGGSLVFVGTLDALHAYPGGADASVGMGALLGLVRSLAVELAPLGVRANAVLAGPRVDAEAGADAALVARTRLRSPSGRGVTDREVAATVVFAVGPDAGFMTGSAVRVDGGWASLNQAPEGMRFR